MFECYGDHRYLQVLPPSFPTPRSPVLNALAATPRAKPPTSRTHRLRRRLPGYLIRFAPHAFAPQRQVRAREPPSPPVFFPISTNFTSTLGIPLSSPDLQDRKSTRLNSSH